MPPKISGKVKARINTGATGRIRCIAYGFPRPTFKWRFVTDTGNVISLFTGENRQKMSVLPTVYEDSSDYARSELRIKDVKPLYWKTYTCIAMNSEGSDVHNFSLSGFGKCAKVSVY